MKFALNAFTLIASCLLSACASPTMPYGAGPSPLVVASCPELTPMADGADMGTMLDKLTEVAGTYYVCREAALGGKGERKGK
jgi:hypothetical protein